MVLFVQPLRFLERIRCIRVHIALLLEAATDTRTYHKAFEIEYKEEDNQKEPR